MTGIETAALVTSLVAVAALGTLIWQLCAAADRRWLTALVVLNLPMSALTFYGVRLPLDSVLTESLGKASPFLIPCKLCYAPVTEELAKLIPLLLTWPIFHRPLINSNRVPVAMALGLGFAIGEIWLLARLVGNQPDIARLPFYQFGGFFSERLSTCITHSGFAVLSIWGLQRGGVRRTIGVAAAMLFHFLGNLPIFLMNFDAGNLGKPAWMTLVSIWLLICLLVSVILLSVMHAGTRRIIHLVTSAKAKCPECGAVYRQPILGGNFGVWRYEPCGACHKWHWISLKEIQ